MGDEVVALAVQQECGGLVVVVLHEVLLVLVDGHSSIIGHDEPLLPGLLEERGVL